MRAPRLLFLSVLTVLMSVGLVSSVQAQSPEGIQLNPAVIEEKADPGQTFTFTLRVTNIADVEKTFYLVTQDIKGIDDRGAPQFSDDTEPTVYSMSSWVVLPQESVTLKGQETKALPITVRVPATASPGSHFGGVFLDARPPKLRTIGAGVGIRVGSIVSLRISGDVKEEARIREFSTSRLVYGTPSVTFETKVEALGNTLVRPEGFIEITDIFGKQVGNIRVNEEKAAVFPENDRTFLTAWEYDRFAFGRYQALATIVYGEEDRKTISRATSFWILPLKPILITLTSLLAVILFIYVMVRRYIRNKLRELGIVPGKQAGGDAYTRRYQKSLSRLMAISVSLLLFSVFLLVVLFLMFA
jgi:hypothetical protein